MSDVKRYALDQTRGEMFEIAKGAYVAHKDYAAIHSLLVKACIEFAHKGAWLEDIEKAYGIRIHQNGLTFEEDTTK